MLTLTLVCQRAGYCCIRFALLFIAFLTLACQPPRPPVPTMEPTPPGLTRETHERVIQMARQDHEEGRCERAVSPLERVLASDPEPQIRLEAHWWLAQCQDQLGNPQAALAHYQAVAASFSGAEVSSHPYAVTARQRLAEAGEVHDRVDVPAPRQLAVMPGLEEIEALAAHEDRLRALKMSGGTAVIVPAGTAGGIPRAGVDAGSGRPAGILFRSGWGAPARDLIGELVPAAHREGLAVYVSVTLRAMPWLHPQLGWQDWFYDPASRQPQPSRYLDVFNPGFQEYLAGILGDLARSGADGILFRADAPSGPLEGFSPAAQAQFQREFGAPVDLAGITAGWHLYEQSTGATVRQGVDVPGAAHGSAFWRWIGWKSRETLKLTDRLVRVVRRLAPRTLCLLEVHQEAVTDPRTALVRYGEDLVGARRIQFDGIVIGIREQPRMDPRNVARDLEQRARVVGEEPNRIWLEVPVSTGPAVSDARAGMPALADLAGLPSGHLIAIAPALALP